MKDTKKSIIENVKKELDKIDSGIFDKYNNYHKNGRSWMEMSIEKHWWE